MSSLNALQTRALAAETKQGRVLDDGSVAIRIAYTGTSTSAPVISVITATSLTLTTSLGATVFTFATFSTLALLTAAINSGLGDGGVGAAGKGFTARIMDALPSTVTTASNLVVSAGLVSTTVAGETVYDVMLDTSTTKMVAFRVSMDRNINVAKPWRGHRVKLNNFVYNVNVSLAEAGAVRVYEYSKLSGATTLVWAATSVDATNTTVDFATVPMTAAEGSEYIVAITDGTSVTDAAANFLQVGYTLE